MDTLISAITRQHSVGMARFSCVLLNVMSFAHCEGYSHRVLYNLTC